MTGWRYYGWWGIVLAAFLIIWTTNGLTIGGVAAFDPYLLDTLQIARGPLKFGDFIQLATAAIFTVGSGWAADRYGVRPVMTVGVVLLATAFLGYAYVDALSHVYWLRFLMGVGLSCAGLAICVVIVSRWFFLRRGLALGLMLAGTSLSNALFPSVFTSFIESFGWRTAALYVSVTPLLLLPIIWLALKEWPERIGLKPYGAAAAAAPANVAGDELSYRDILARLEFWLLGIAAFATFYAILGTSQNLILHGRDLGFTPAQAAALFFPLFITGLLGKIGSGFLSDWLGRRLVWIGNLSLMLAGALLLATLDKTLIVAAVALFGLGWGGNYSLLQALAADFFGTRSLGRVMGAITVLDASGGALGPWVTSALFDRFGSYAPGFWLIAGLIGLAIVMALLLGARVTRLEASARA